MASIYLVINFIFLLNLAVGEDLLELGCLNDQQCKQFEKMNINVSCTEGHCQCKDVETKRIVICMPQDIKINNIIGGHCPCQMPKAVCKEEQNICYCAPGYVASGDKRRCLVENVSLGEECETNKQCHTADFYAVCDEQKKMCICQTNFTIHNGTCVSVADPLATCHNDSDCSAFGTNVICLKDTKKCICNEGHVKSKNKTECLQMMAYQEHCTEDQQCLRKLGPGGACISGACGCGDKHYVFVENQQTLTNKTLNENGTVTLKSESSLQKSQVMCARIVEIGEYCYDDKDCFKLPFPNAEQTMACIYSECNCKWGYYSIDNMECVKGNRGSRTCILCGLIIFLMPLHLLLLFKL